MRDDPGFRTGGTPGGRWGCLLGVFFFVCWLPFAGMLMMGDEGPPGAQNRAMFALMGGAALAGGALGFAVRALVNWAWMRRGGEEAFDGAKTAPLWAMTAALAAFAASVWLFFTYWFGDI